MGDTTAVVFRSDPKASSQITPALKRVVHSNYSATVREGGRGRDDRKAVGRLGDAGTLAEFVPVLGATGSATPVAVPEAQGEVGGRRALLGREAVAGLRIGTPAGAEAAQRPAAQVAPVSHTDRVVPDWISAWRE